MGKASRCVEQLDLFLIFLKTKDIWLHEFNLSKNMSYLANAGIRVH